MAKKNTFLTLFFLVGLFGFACADTAPVQDTPLEQHSEAHGDHGDHEGGHHGHDVLPPHAEVIGSIGAFQITNSMLMMWIVTILIVVFAQLATRNVKLIPSGLQNFAEWLVEGLYGFLENILGEHLTKRTFWFFATIFILILFTNWLGLVPGVGTIGWHTTGDPNDTFRPFLRGGNADLNMTFAMSAVFFVMWFYWAFSENGTKGFFAHIFAPKGSFKGPMFIMMIIIFFMVGLIEMASIGLRPVALMFRLYGNVYAGETMLESIMNLVPVPWLKWLPVLPFYFLELLVGLIQALVFMLLTSVFLKLICDHGDHDEEHAH